MNTELTFQYPHPPTSEEAIAAFEKELGFRLPEDYRQFLLKYNGGGLPNWGRFSYQLSDGFVNNSSVSAFFGLGITASGELRKWQGVEAKPDYLFLIGTSLSSLLGIGLNGDHQGKIYVWENTISDEIILLANSFNEFLDMLSADC